MVGNAIRAKTKQKTIERVKAKGRNEEEINVELCVDSNILII
jgi:hypothetical protein